MSSNLTINQAYTPKKLQILNSSAENKTAPETEKNRETKKFKTRDYMIGATILATTIAAGIIGAKRGWFNGAINKVENDANNNVGGFYTGFIQPLFEKFGVDYNSVKSGLPAFGKLLNQIRRTIQINALRQLSEQKSVESLLKEYEKLINSKLEIVFDFKNKKGDFIPESVLNDYIRNCAKGAEISKSGAKNVETLLNVHYKKGLDFIEENFGKKFDELAKMYKDNSPDTQKHFETLIENLKFNYELLMRTNKSPKQIQIG